MDSANVIKVGNVVNIKEREFRVVSLLGSGTEGVVYKIQHTKSGVEYACKVVSEQFMGNAIREARYMRTLYTPDSMTPKVYNVQCFPDKTTLIVMELLKGVTLLDLVQESWNGLAVTVLKSIFRQLLLAIKYIHSKGIAHRDLKCENIMVGPDNKITIIDFGFAAEYSSNRFLRDDVGSMNYAAPEVLAGKPYRGPEADLFTMGIIFYTCMTGRFPYYPSDDIQVTLRLRGQPIKFKPGVPSDLKALISMMMSIDQEYRYKLSLDMDALLDHPFFCNE